MEYALDIIGNKVRVGDEVIHTPYGRYCMNEYLIKPVKAIKKNKVSVNTNRKGNPTFISRFIKVVKEVE